jgi:nucleoside-diphosphate-sugar epimerase
VNELVLVTGGSGFIGRIVYNPGLRQIIPELGRTKSASHNKAVRMLGWTPRLDEDAVLSTAESLVKLDLLRNGKRQA